MSAAPLLEIAHLVRYFPVRNAFGPLTRWLRSRGASTTGPEYGLNLVAMVQAGARLLGQLAPYDAVLTPTLAQLPALVRGIRHDDDPAADFEAQ